MSNVYGITMFFMLFGFMFFLFFKTAWNKLTLVHFYLAAVLMSYGGYSLIHILSNWNSEHDWLLTLSVHAFVYIEILIFFFVLNFFFQWVLSATSFSGIFDGLAEIPDVILTAVLFVLGVALTVFLTKYGMFSYFLIPAEENRNIELPYLLIAFRMHLLSLLAGCFVAAFAKCSLKPIKKTVFNWPIVVAIGFLLALHGRRAIFYPLIASVIGFAKSRRKNIFTIRSGVITVCFLLVLILVSNFYQNFRRNFMEIVTHGMESQSFSTLNWFFDFDSSVQNAETRTPDFKVDEQVLRKMNGEIIPLANFGELTRSQLLSSIPRILMPSKKAVVNETFFVKYAFDYWTDLPTSIFSEFLLDYGYLAIIFVPIFLIFSWCANTKILRVVSPSPVFFLIVFSLIFSNIIAIEGGMTQQFVLLRENILILFIYKMIEPLLKRWRSRKTQIHRSFSNKLSTNSSL